MGTYRTSDLGQLNRGDIVTVQLSGDAPNVRLMDSVNHQRYRSGSRYDFYGGVAKRTIVPLGVPHDGHWYLVVDFRGLQGSVRSAVRVTRLGRGVGVRA
jgi:hypothetical protein